MSRSYADLVCLIVGEIMRLNPQVGAAINRDALAATLEENPDSRRFRMAFHEARDDLVEMTPSMMFKVKRGDRGNYVRIAEHERAELGGARYLRKARRAALRGVRRVARTDTTQLNSDERRLHEHRMVQSGNAWTGIDDAIKSR